MCMAHYLGFFPPRRSKKSNSATERRGHLVLGDAVITGHAVVNTIDFFHKVFVNLRYLSYLRVTIN